MKDYEKARLLAKEIKRLANTSIHCFDGYESPAAISVNGSEFPPATPGQVLAELNIKRKNRGIGMWTMNVGDSGYPKDVEETLTSQINYRSNILFFPPLPRSKKTSSPTRS